MRGSGESGGAAVEAAIILPAMLVLLLCAIQIAQLQQARVMAEYAAFNAARAGIVQNGNNGADGTSGPMHDAAVLSILPTWGRTDGFTALGRTWADFRVRDAVLRAFGLPQVKVYVLSPHKQDFPRFGQHLDRQELDFDDVRPQAAEAALLSIQVRYLYELRVPFANKLIQTIWLASHVGPGRARALEGWTGWDLSSPRATVPNGRDAVELSRALALAGHVDDGTPDGINLGALTLAGNQGRYFLPIQAWYTMRMQSNPFAKWSAP